MALWLENIDQSGNLICEGKFSKGTVKVADIDLTLSDAQSLVKRLIPVTFGNETIWRLRIR
jgi:hypothetical protein